MNKTNVTLTVGNSVTLSVHSTVDGVDTPAVTWSAGNSCVTVDQNGKVTAKSAGFTTVTATSSDGAQAKCNVTVNSSGGSGNEGNDPGGNTGGSTADWDGVDYGSGDAVDLGLSVCWASRNIEATSAEKVGGYFAWGQTYSKSTFNYNDCPTYNVDMSSSNQYVDYSTKMLKSSYDAATANWGSSWRMPSKAEIEELITKCTWKSSTKNGVSGCLVTGPSGNSIFIPNSGYKHTTSNGTQTWGSGDAYFWSGEAYPDSKTSYSLIGEGYSAFSYNIERYEGLPVRGVKAITKQSQTITWNQDLSDLKVGGSYELTATASSGLQITYAITQGKELASLSDNVLTCLGAGEITIKATQEGDRGHQSAYVSRTFTITKDRDSQSIYWNQDLSLLYVGDSFKLSATASSGLPVTYKITEINEGDSPANLDGDVLYCNSVGEFTIGAFQDGNDDYEAADPIYKTCMIQESIAPTAISLPSSLTLKYGATAWLTPEIQPENAVTGFLWISSNEAVATVSDEGLVTAVGEGNASITAETTLGGLTASCKVTVTPKPLNFVTELNGGALIVMEMTNEPKVLHEGEWLTIEDETVTYSYIATEVHKFYMDWVNEGNSASDALADRFNGSIKLNQGEILLQGFAPNTEVCVYSLSGILMDRQTIPTEGSLSIQTIAYAPGTYIVKADNNTLKFIKK